ncbi:DUF397 domain-containing protein [Polymorphospora rubra]|uniref:DUF397 domain-containing protein n=1 Tax=Polymorphospora rubra TaxID=338584 RepID=UPI0033E4D51C
MDTNTFTDWRKSTRSGGGDNCVEVATENGTIGIRDSKDPTGPILTFTRTEWAAFLAGVRSRSFDL